jgi:hypothetical protein
MVMSPTGLGNQNDSIDEGLHQLTRQGLRRRMGMGLGKEDFFLPASIYQKEASSMTSRKWKTSSI